MMRRPIILLPIYYSFIALLCIYDAPAAEANPIVTNTCKWVVKILVGVACEKVVEKGMQARAEGGSQVVANGKVGSKKDWTNNILAIGNVVKSTVLDLGFNKVEDGNSSANVHVFFKVGGDNRRMGYRSIPCFGEILSADDKPNPFCSNYIKWNEAAHPPLMSALVKNKPNKPRQKATATFSVKVDGFVVAGVGGKDFPKDTLIDEDPIEVQLNDNHQMQDVNIQASIPSASSSDLTVFSPNWDVWNTFIDSGTATEQEAWDYVIKQLQSSNASYSFYQYQQEFAGSVEDEDAVDVPAPFAVGGIPVLFAYIRRLRRIKRAMIHHHESMSGVPASGVTRGDQPRRSRG
jgi:hypothetical protein